MAEEAQPFANVDDNAPLAFGLVFAAGLSTAVGAAVVYVNRAVQLASKSVLAAGLGFSSGVMLYVSFIEIFGKAVDAFSGHGVNEEEAYLFATISFFAGIIMMKFTGYIVHRLDSSHHCHDIPGTEGIACNERQKHSDGIDLEEQPPAAAPAGPQPEEAGVAAPPQAEVVEGGERNAQPPAVAAAAEAKAEKQSKDHALQQMGISTALAIAIHNFPEGLATFVATLAEPAVGVTLAIAIAIHNVPEGLCVALPVFYASGNRHAAFAWALLSGISEPIGALLGYAIIKSTGDDMNQIVYGVLFGLVAGMMVAIVLLDLLPTAQRYDPTNKYTTNFVFLGMFVMASSLVIFLY
jgi:ZIP family zinc transporter